MRVLRIQPTVAAVILAALALAAATGCGGDEAPAAPTPPPAPTPTEEATATPDKPAGATAGQVASDIAGFTLEVLQVSVGTTVTWTNQDNSGHTVTAGSLEVPNDEFASLTLNRGESFSHTFQSAGTFRYDCAIHPDTSNAVVTVTEM